MYSCKTECVFSVCKQMNPYLHKDVISVQYKAERLISMIDLVEAMVEYIRNYHLITERWEKNKTKLH